MGRKVFISFLGNTKYTDTVYTDLNGCKRTPTPFVQEVLFDSLCNEWGDEDRIYVICTKGERGSYNTNWIGGQEHASLKEILEGKPYAKSVKHACIEEGVELDIWRLFETIDELIPEDGKCEVYLDVTNAFRIFPTFATTFLQYATFMKKIKVKGLYYGLYKNPQEAPLIDLCPILQLQECVNMANGLDQYGRLNVLSKGIGAIPEYEKAAEAILGLDNALSSNIGLYIREGKFMDVLNQNRKRLKASSLPAPTKNILTRTLEELRDFKSGGREDNLLAAARWNFKHGMLPQAYAMGKEYINRVVASRFAAISPYRDQKIFLEYINAILSISEEVRMNRSYQNDLLKYLSLTELIINDDNVASLRKGYPLFNVYRNALAHLKNSHSYEEMHAYFERNFEQFVSIVKNMPVIEKDKQEMPGTSLFINLTNHHSSLWSESQLAAARGYGEIHDVPFPQIDGMADEKAIAELVQKTIADIQQMSENWTCRVTVHIMGEMTFTYAMVQALTRMGITCLASTTERIVEEGPDGRKVVQFRFERFREYR